MGNRLRTAALVVAGLVFVLPAPAWAQDNADAAAAEKDVLLAALLSEMDRSMANLKEKEADPLYYLSYRVHDQRTFRLSASYGAITDPGPSGPNAGRSRSLDVAVRVGNPNVPESSDNAVVVGVILSIRRHRILKEPACSWISPGTLPTK